MTTDTNRSKKQRSKSKDISRRDFIGGALIGTGVSLLHAAAPSVARAQSAGKPKYLHLGTEWTGPGGIGDYAVSNGNTHHVVNAAHSIRDGYWKNNQVHKNTAEEYDLVVVGGGFSGFMSAYEFLKKSPKGRVLILENHPVFGGEAKQNEFNVDGVHLHAPQGSNGTLWPPENAEKLGFFFHPVWYELGLPRGDSPEALKWMSQPTGTKKNIRFPEDNYDSMILFREEASQGYFFKDDKSEQGYQWVKDPWRNGYEDIPWSDAAKADLRKLEAYTDFPKRADWEKWLDSMTYKEFLINEVGITQPEIFIFLNPAVAAHGPGMGCDIISAYAALGFGMPGVNQGPVVNTDAGSFTDSDTPVSLVSFPGGNAGILRHFVKKLIPAAIEGNTSLHDIVYGKINFAALDKADQNLRVRLNSTVVDVRHDGPAESAKAAYVSYLDNETHTTHQVKAKAVIMASGQWVNKHVIKDAPEQVNGAMAEFYHAPMLVVNVAVKNWRFMEKLGISAARWFEGFGWYTNIRAPMVIDGQHSPLDPDKPTVLTFYNPFTDGISDSGLPIRHQTMMARTKLFSMPYSTIENDVRQQLNALFGPYGFDDQKDIAEIVTNRWGHAYITPQPGFFYGKDGKPAPRDIVRAGYGRIRFAHSELYGDQLWTIACEEGERAANQVLDFI